MSSCEKRLGRVETARGVLKRLGETVSKTNVMRTLWILPCHHLAAALPPSAPP